MKSNNKTDLLILSTILREQEIIKQAMANDNITTWEELKKSLMMQRVISQSLTTIYEGVKQLQVNTGKQLQTFNRGTLRKIRNFSSHAYWLIDWEQIFDVANEIVKDKAIKEVKSVIESVKGVMR